MHILDIPLACCLTPRSALLSISRSHFLSSISPEPQSNRAHQTGWSVQNCNVLLIDLKSMSMYVEVRIHSMCDPLPTHCCFFWFTYKHSVDVDVCQIRFCMCLMSLYYVFKSLRFYTSPLSWTPLRWRGRGRWWVGRGSLQHSVQREFRAPQVRVAEKGWKQTF